jgi:hypothetical protein
MIENIATNPVGVDNSRVMRAFGQEAHGLTVVVMCVPGGFDRFFAACAEEFKKGEPELPLLVKLAAEYGIEFQFGLPS